MRSIYLDSGDVTWVDTDDYDQIVRYPWSMVARGKNRYAYRREYTHGKCMMIFLHRFLLNAPAGKMVDHINGDGLDNRRCNLRICSNAENQRNSRCQSNNRSGFKGVRKCGNRWRATIHVAGGTTSIGYFDTAEEAAKAYDKHALSVWGIYARTNFPRIG